MTVNKATSAALEAAYDPVLAAPGQRTAAALLEAAYDPVLAAPTQRFSAAFLDVAFTVPPAPTSMVWVIGQPGG